MSLRRIRRRPLRHASLFLVAFGVAAGLAATAFAASHASTPGVTDTEVTLGAPLPLSGPYKVYGDFVTPGLSAAFDYANKHGGVNGRRIHLVTADSGCTDAGQGVQAARQVLQQDHAFMLVATECPTVVNAINQTLLAGTPTFNLSITGAGRDFSSRANQPAKRGYFYSLNASTTSMMVDLMQWAVKNLHVKTFGVLAGTDSYGVDGINGIGAAVKQLNLPKPTYTRIDETATDASVQIAQLKAAGVEAILMPAFASPAIAALRAMQSSNWNVPVLAASAAWGSIPTVQAVGVPAVQNVYVASQSKLLQSDPAFQAQIEKYKAYNLNSTTVGMTWTGELAVEMLKAAGRNLTQQSFLKAVYSNTFPSSYYGPINFAQTKGYAELNHCVTIYKWIAGSGGTPTQQRVTDAYTCPSFKVPGLG
jgi:ABC-type branched-subunit amino acid transport system substrate-binding protein